ncbi:MAG: hypothetical protein ACI9KN_000829 [Gammaproteobacteria bacterium]|jgi:hypothetical protein
MILRVSNQQLVELGKLVQSIKQGNRVVLFPL